jgi:hypothetical protein
LLFRGSRDGWDCKVIHAKIDDQGPTITIIKTLKGNIFGGFASVSWESSCYGSGFRGFNSMGGPISKFSKADQNAFLFSVDLGIKSPVNLS